MTLIPKTIHYCWFGGARKSALVKRCVRSWKKYCPDYNIIEWNERNFNIADAPVYVQQAYGAKKWAFVSDYVRLFALYQQGGVYVDTDLEVVRPIDRFLEHAAFTSFEDEKSIPTAIMGSIPKHKWIGLLLSDYNNRLFVNPDGSCDCTTNVVRITQITSAHYNIVLNNSYQALADGVVIYPNYYFCPKIHSTQEIVITDDTYTIHHFNASWFSKEDKIEYRRHKSIGPAFVSYQKQDWRSAYRKAIAGIFMCPRLMLNKGVWSIILKSFWRDFFSRWKS